MSAWPNLTSSLRSFAATAIASTGGYGRTLRERRVRLFSRRQGIARIGMVEFPERDRFAGLRPPHAFRKPGPCSLNTPATRPASRSGVLNVVPSLTCVVEECARSTFCRHGLVCRVFST